MRRSRNQSGEGQGGCLVSLIVFLAVIFVAYKIIPVKVHAAEVRQVVTDEAKSAGQHTDERIRKSILITAKSEGLPITDDDIKIDRSGNIIHLDVDYTVPIAFPGYTYQMHINHHAENPIF